MSYSDRFLEAHEQLMAGQNALAIAALKSLSEEGHIDAQNLLGWAYLVGIGVERDVDEAKRLLSRSEASGSAEGAFFLGRACAMQGLHEEAVRHYQFSAQADYPPAMFRLAMALKTGQGTEQDIAKACRYLQKAAQHDHRMALRELAFVELRGTLGLSRVTSGVAHLLKLLWLTGADIFRRMPSREHIT